MLGSQNFMFGQPDGLFRLLCIYNNIFDDNRKTLKYLMTRYVTRHMCYI